MVTDNVRKTVLLVVLCLVIFVGGWFANYFLATPRIVTHEVEKVVVKYIKGDTITQKPDGTIIVTGNASLDSHETENIKDKEETNTRTLMVAPYAGFGAHENVAGVLLQKDMFGRFGIIGGAQITIEKKDLMGIIGISVRL